jgi:hypothetical protein
MKILAPKIGALHTGPKKQHGNFLENGSNSFGYISAIYGDALPK